MQQTVWEWGAEALNKATAGLIQSQAKDNAKAIADTIVLISILTVLAIIAGLLAA
ncbi:hypothetical protein ORG37_02735 [Rahnella perminowiae]|nr:hypothetical protein [Rahnella perminowiae]